MSRFFKDRTLLRFLIATFFAAAFVWVAVQQFDVETEVVWVFFLLSMMFVAIMAVAGLLLAPIVRRFSSRPTLLSSIDTREDANEQPATEEDVPPSNPP